MDGQALQQRLKAIKLEIAAIRALESRYKLRGARSPIEKAAHAARRETLKAIKLELASLLPAGDKAAQTALAPHESALL
jgi:hypothetical protein